MANLGCPIKSSKEYQDFLDNFGSEELLYAAYMSNGGVVPRSFSPERNHYIDDANSKIKATSEGKEEVKTGVSELFESNPELANAVYEALRLNIINESEITYTDEEGNPCAKVGGKSSKFTKGGKWEIVKEFKGASHERGGIDISIGNGKISMTNKQGKIEAKYGLVINSKTLK